MYIKISPEKNPGLLCAAFFEIVLKHISIRHALRFINVPHTLQVFTCIDIITYIFIKCKAIFIAFFVLS